MLVENQMIEMTWMPTTKEYYENLGYAFTKMRQKFLVKAEDLSYSSNKIVEIKCDYCSKIYKTKFYLHTSAIKINGKDCCEKCASIKQKESMLNKYGVENPFSLKEVQEKIKDTNLKKYGCENVGQSEFIKSKIIKTNMEKYGVPWNIASEEIRQKAKETCKERYGVENVFLSKEFQEKARKTQEEKYGSGNIAHTPEISEKIKQTNLVKYGVPYTTQAPEVIKKMRESLFKNGNVPTSKAENNIVNMLQELYGEENCFPGFPLDRINMDCLLIINNIKIDVEYDGWYWHKNTQEKDKRRNYWLIKQGYKVLRIRALEAIPSIEQLKDGIEFLINSNHHLYYIDLDIDI